MITKCFLCFEFSPKKSKKKTFPSSKISPKVINCSTLTKISTLKLLTLCILSLQFDQRCVSSKVPGKGCL